ncbi:MAG: NADH-quinone oxidoreductase subunit N [Candidatus Omnitrophica bacterium]|nr:NADH-quinone oxidoreductase subunit N [Candidatus Omnitrophota bacterium]
MGIVESLRFFVPELVLLAGAFLVSGADLFLRDKRTIRQLSLLVLIAAALYCRAPGEPRELFFGMFRLDTFAHFFRYFALAAVGLTILLASDHTPLKGPYEGEVYGLFLFMAFALILVAGANNLLMIFLSIEFVSMVSYLLVGFLKKDARCKEAALKYLLFGSVSSAFMLYGMSLLYGAAGSLTLPAIGESLLSAPFRPLAHASVLFFFVGLGFKISMAPFHLWAPDVYEGAPTPVTAFLTVAPKALGFAVFMRVLATVFTPTWAHWGVLLTALSMLTMTLGNVTALSQNNIKRFLAYSSIAQAGYILMGMAVFSDLGRQSVLVYLLAYLFTNLGAFAVVVLVSERTGSEDLAAYAGLSERSPFAAAALTVFLLSLAGIPPLAGFIGKYYVFAAAIQGKFIVLTVVAAVNSVIAAYYYFRVIRLMYLVPASSPALERTPRSLAIALGFTLAGVLLVGLLPSLFVGWIGPV